RIVLEKLPDNLLKRVYILFPDPWPKARHHKRRIISHTMLALLAKKIAPNGELIVATDHLDYADWIKEHLLNTPHFTPHKLASSDFRTAPVDWMPTRYQQKAESLGL